MKRTIRDSNDHSKHTCAFQIQYLVYSHGFDHSTMSVTKHGCAIFESLLSAICLIIKHRESDQSKGNHTTSTPSHNMPNHDSSCILNSQSFFVFFFFLFFGCFVGVVGGIGVESCHLSQNSLAQKRGTKLCTVMLNRSTNLLSILQTDLSILLI